MSSSTKHFVCPRTFFSKWCILVIKKGFFLHYTLSMFILLAVTKTKHILSFKKSAIKIHITIIFVVFWYLIYYHFILIFFHSKFCIGIHNFFKHVFFYKWDIKDVLKYLILFWMSITILRKKFRLSETYRIIIQGVQFYII